MRKSSSSFNDLKTTAASLGRASSPQEEKEALISAFEKFSKESARLESAYLALKKQYEEINLELQAKVQELDDTKYYLESIVGNMSQGLIFVGREGLIKTFNASAQVMLGKNFPEVIDKSFWDCFPDDIFGFSIQKSLQQWRTPRRSFITIQKDSEEIDLEIEASFVDCRTSPQKFTQGMIILLRDITKLRRLQRIANQNDRMKEIGAMAARVAHEIRNPLGGIKGFASLLLRDLKDNPENCKLLQYIIDGTDDLNTLVTSILNYSRPLRLDLQRTDLGELIQKSVEHLKADPDTSQEISFEVFLPNEKITVDLDQRLIHSLLLNLLKNSIQAIEEKGLITINLFSHGIMAKITIKDTGKGIAKEHMEKIFTPFFTTKPKGHGFGLAEAYRVIQEHHGHIEVTSEVGKGTTVAITIPCEGLGIFNE